MKGLNYLTDISGETIAIQLELKFFDERNLFKQLSEYNTTRGISYLHNLKGEKVAIQISYETHYKMIDEFLHKTSKKADSKRWFNFFSVFNK